MRYGIILTVDAPRDCGIRQFLPPRRVVRKMQLTEGDENYEYSYLEGPWTKGRHRKLVGLLKQRDFDTVVEDCSLYAEDIETMGSLGVPWSVSGFGIAPAISFNSYEDGAIINAYVTPIPDVRLVNRFNDGEWVERCWDRVRCVILRKYGRGR